MSNDNKQWADDVGFDDASAGSVEFTKYAGVKGTTDRLAFVHLKPDGKIIVKKAQIHYVPGIGYFRSNDFAKQKFGEPKTRYATIVGQYRTNKVGKVESLEGIVCKFYIFGDKKYVALKQANDMFPFDKHDILSTCTEEKFQQCTFQSCKEAAWSVKPEIKAAVLAQVEKLAPHLDNQLGRDLTVEQIKEKLGTLDTSPASDADTPAVSADDIIASL